MNITLKLFATLTDYMPDGANGNVLDMPVAEGKTVGELIEELRLPEKLVHLVLVNGNYIAPDARASSALSEGDTLAIWPPIAGG